MNVSSEIREWVVAEQEAGRPLPTQEVIAQKFGVSQPTVAQAIKVLRRGPLTDRQAGVIKSLNAARAAVEREEWDMVAIMLERARKDLP